MGPQGQMFHGALKRRSERLVYLLQKNEEAEAGAVSQTAPLPTHATGGLPTAYRDWPLKIFFSPSAGLMSVQKEKENNSLRKRTRYPTSAGCQFCFSS